MIDLKLPVAAVGSDGPAVYRAVQEYVVQQVAAGCRCVVIAAGLDEANRLKALLADAFRGHYGRDMAVEIRDAARCSVGSRMPAKSLEL